ncbi:MAG: thioredoxin family protein [Planctomycetota bacterium]
MSTAIDPALTPDFLKFVFESGLGYADYVATADADKRAKWDAFYDSVRLTGPQHELIGGFVREMPVLVISGVWCGDCVQQCPILARIAEANPRKVNLRFADRDEQMALAEQVKICGGTRVPVAIFMAEDFEPVQIFGDRTLTRYRKMAEAALGANCPVPGAPVPAEEVAEVTADWVDVFERNQLLLRLSTRLRQKHSD